jgi:hypothetical protein
MISSKNVYENESIQSIVIQNVPKLERIESKAFTKSDIRFLAATFESGSRLPRIEVGHSSEVS